MKDAGEERSFVVDLKKLRPLFPLMATVRYFGKILVGPSQRLASLRKSWEKQFFHSPRQLHIKKVKLKPPTKIGYQLSREL